MLNNKEKHFLIKLLYFFIIFNVFYNVNKVNEIKIRIAKLSNKTGISNERIINKLKRKLRQLTIS